jgi:hypothetical protein
MRSGAVLFLILVSALMVPPALAAGNVKLDTDQQEYYFVVGSSADIPITVTSTYSDILQGTIRLSTEEQLQQPGLSMISTQNRVYPCEVKPGTDIKVISVGTSATPRIYRLHITYYYDSPSPVEATLPEILVHFVSDPQRTRPPI